MSIETRCLVVNLSIGVWSGQRLDKRATRKMLSEAGAADDAARVNKHIVPKEMLKDLISAQSALRQYVYKNTLPWGDNADRLLPSARYFDFMEGYRVLAEAFKEAVRVFIEDRYPGVKSRAQFHQGALFDPNDYPHADDLWRRFYVGVSVAPVATGDDFRVDMDDETVETLRRELEADMAERVKGAVLALKERLAKTLGHFVEKLTADDAIWRNTALTNLQSLVETLPALNVTNDADIAAAYDTLKTTVLGWEADALRKNANDRKSVASDARSVLDDLLATMTAGRGDGEDE